jgi:hypothetical protein
MKIVKLSSFGGSCKQTARQAVGAGEDFDKKLAGFKERAQAHTDAVKRQLAQWIEKTTHPADYVSVSMALLELGIERRLGLHDEEDARDLTEQTFRRVVQRRRGPLQ